MAVTLGRLVLLGDGHGQVARAGADVEDARLGHRLRQAQALVDDALGVRPRDEHGRADLELQREELLAADEVGDRAALDAACGPARGSAAGRRRRPPPRSACTGRCACSRGRGPAAPRASRRGDSQPFCARNCVVQSSSRPIGPGLSRVVVVMTLVLPRRRADGASVRRNAPSRSPALAEPLLLVEVRSAWISSPRSPAMMASSLYSVRLMRWSVTRFCGKL